LPASQYSNQRKRLNNDLSARHWHNRYIAWQAREKRQREEKEKLKAEQDRLFGEAQDDDEDEWLCGQMLNYFGSLDYIVNE